MLENHISKISLLTFSVSPSFVIFGLMKKSTSKEENPSTQSDML